MSLRERIIENEQNQFEGFEYDESVDESVNGLCYGEGCHEECFCVKTFTACVRRSFEEQEQERARKEFYNLEDAYKIVSDASGKAAVGSMVAWRKVSRIKDYVDARMTEEFGIAFAE